MQELRKKLRNAVVALIVIFVGFILPFWGTKQEEEAKVRTSAAVAVKNMATVELVKTTKSLTPLVDRLNRTNILGRYGPVRASIATIRYKDVVLTNSTQW